MTSLSSPEVESTLSEQTIQTLEALEPVKKPTNHFRSVFASTFLTIFFAEMGDKTQLSTLLMSAESRSPWVVFLGSALALIATSLLGVSIGYWIARRLSPKTLDLAVAVLLLFITGLLLNDVITG
ncbi:MAG: TMEM165/GDT1 family protein [Snowella sp.]|nr:TMEM165/GDT1 family protein [Snowella sp.]